MKNRKRAIAKCPACHQGIFQNHPDSQCHKCNKPLPEEIIFKLKNPDSLESSSANLASTEIITIELRKRAAWLHIIAALIMGGIILLTLIGIFIFLKAGYTAQQETTTGTMLRAIDNVGLQLRRVGDSLEGKSGSQPQPANPRAPTPSAHMKPEPDLNADEIRNVLQQIPSFKKTIEEATGALKTDLGDNRVMVPILVSSTSQRIGIVVLLIFLIQILVPAYRYNIKLAAFYEARADALEMRSEIPDCPLDKLILLLSPDSINFGKGISSPTDNLLEVVKEAAKVGRPPDGIK